MGVKGVIIVEDILKKILAGQELMGKQLNTLIEDVHSLKNDVSTLKDDVNTLKGDVNILKSDVNILKSDVNALKGDVQILKESVHRIEHHQEDTIMGMLNHIKRQVDTKESQIQVLNKRLFDVETKTENIQQ